MSKKGNDLCKRKLIALLPQLPPSYRQKEPAVPNKCDTCKRSECKDRGGAICWTKCGGWLGKPAAETEDE